MCELEGGDILELAQLPGHPIYVRGAITGLTADSSYSITINTKGRLGAACDETGEEFNPLFETDKYGNPNPFQDPSRGRLTIPDSDANGDITIDTTKLMQNLAGHDSILGRSMTLKAADDSVLGCCVIALDMAPMVEEPATSTPVPHNHYQPYYPPHYYNNQWGASSRPSYPQYAGW